MGCHFLLQRIFPTQGSNLGLPHCRQMLYHLSHEGNLKPILLCIHVQPLSCVRLCDPMDGSPPGSSVQGISQHKYWSGLPFPSPGDLPNSGIESMSPVSVGFSRRERWRGWPCPPPLQGFPDGSDGRASACNAGDPGLIPGSGRSPGERSGNPLQYSCLENSTD